MRFGLAEGQTVLRVDEGRADVAIADVGVQPNSEIARIWGPGSDNSGRRRPALVSRSSLPGIDTIVLNPTRKLLKDRDVRRAIALALDRAALASSFAETAGYQLLSPAFQVQDPLVSELVGPNPTRRGDAHARQDGKAELRHQPGVRPLPRPGQRREGQPCAHWTDRGARRGR